MAFLTLEWDPFHVLTTVIFAHLKEGCFPFLHNSLLVQALETAEMYDRIHLRTTYYNYARHLEERGDTNGAIPK